MIVLVCGGRNFSNKSLLYKSLDALPFSVTKIVNGAASGADKLSTQWAIDNDIPYKEYPAKWNKHGRAAGPIRNSQMLSEEDIDYVVAFPGGNGTEDMVKKAKSVDITVIRVRPK